MKGQAILILWLLGCVFSPSSAIYYFIKPYASQSNCLTVPGNSNSAETKLTIAACSSSAYQKWDNIDGPNLLTLITGVSVGCNNMCLDVVSGTGNEVPIVQKPCNPARLQQYWVQAAAPLGALPGYTWIKNYVTGRCMTDESLVKVDQYDCTSLALHQLWSIGDPDPSVGGLSTITNQLYPTNCLGVKGGSPLSDATTDAALCSTGAFYQHFNVFNQTVETYKNAGSHLCMDGGGSNLEVTYQYGCVSSAANQQWLKFYYPNGGVTTQEYFMDMLSGLCLTYDPSNPNNVHTEACVQGNVNQQWLSMFTL